MEENHKDIDCENPDDKSENRQMQSPIDSSAIQKGRFYVESQKMNESIEIQSEQIKKGRFEITSTLSASMDIKPQDFVKNNETKATDILFEVLDLQNKQIELLFDMIKNISGEEKLFQSEFISFSNDAYEKLEYFKKLKKR